MDWFHCSALPCDSKANTVASVKLLKQYSLKLMEINVPAWRNWQTR